MAPHSEATRSPEIPNCCLAESISMHPVFEALKKYFWGYLPFKNMSWVQTLRNWWSTEGLWPVGVKNELLRTHIFTQTCLHRVFGFFLILENRTFPDDNHEICGFVWVNSPSLPGLFFTSACSEINPCGYHPESALLSQESWKTYSYNSH